MDNAKSNSEAAANLNSEPQETTGDTETNEPTQPETPESHDDSWMTSLSQSSTVSSSAPSNTHKTPDSLPQKRARSPSAGTSQEGASPDRTAPATATAPLKQVPPSSTSVASGQILSQRYATIPEIVGPSLGKPPMGPPRKRMMTKPPAPRPPVNNVPVLLPPLVDPAGQYAPQLKLQRKREMDNIPVLPLQPHVIGGLRDQIEKFKQCNCKRSNCLKLYCDCFQAAIYCTPMCNCHGCKNNSECASDRNHAVEYILHKSHNAFRPRLSTLHTSGSGVPNAKSHPFKYVSSTPTKNGCNCKKSHCLKKYCECFQASVFCTVNCRCLTCQNTEGNPERERLMAKRRTKAKAAATTAATVQEQSRLLGRMAMMGNQNRVSAGAGDGKKPTPAPISTALPTDLPNVEATAALATDAAAAGVDVFLPPSSFAVPMKIPGSGNPWGALAFGKAGDKEIASSVGQSAESSNQRRPLKNKRASPVRPYVHPMTESERNWGVELSRLDATFDAMHWKLLGKGSGEARGYLPDSVATARSNYATRHGFADFQRLVDAVKGAESMARESLESRAERAHECEDVEMPTVSMNGVEGEADDNSVPLAEEDSPLLCSEVLSGEGKEKRISDSSMKQMTMLCAQDTALLRALTGIVRRKTLELTRERIRVVGKAREKQNGKSVKANGTL